MIDLILHLDAHLLSLAHEYGYWVYGILFLIIYAETGLVVAPFLPGDSLLFVAGALCGLGALQMEWLVPILVLAAFAGDNTNYWIGRILGQHLFEWFNGRLVNRKHLDKTRAYYETHGGKTVVFARFLPIVRTFAPFVAGIGLMRYELFMMFSVLGSIAWISLFTLAGYFFGNIPMVKDNLIAIVLVVILISFLPAIFEFIKHKRKSAK